MGHLERGEKNVSFNTLERLAEALGITPSELLSNDAKPTNKRTAATKTGRSSSIRSGNLNGIIRELNRRRTTLEETAGVLRDVAEALRTLRDD
jgi:transcriptional regulator with XRE-family HTH domain